MTKHLAGAAGLLVAALSFAPGVRAQAKPASPAPVPTVTTTTTLVAAPPAPLPPPPPGGPPRTTQGGRVIVIPECEPIPPKLEPLYHQGAFVMRMTLGPGYVWGHGDPNTELTGASAGFNLTLGGFVVDQLALHADVGWMNTYDPEFTADGTTLDQTSVIFQASTFRVGASYYFLPLRVYATVSGGFGVAALTSYTWLSDGSVGLVGKEYTKIGPSFAAEIGKEFEVSPYWGLGLAAHYEFLSVPPGDSHDRLTISMAQQISLRFLATFGER